jgi:transcriptional regulator of NAD metabolism
MAEMRDALEELVSIVKLVHDHPVIENRILDRAVRKAEDVLR